MDSQKSYSNSFKINCKDIIGANAFYQYTNSTNKMEHSYDGDWANNNYWLEFPYNFNPDSTYWEYSFFDKTIRNRGKETHEIRISSDKTRSSSWIVGYHSSRTKELDDATGWLFGGDATSLSTNFDIINTAIYAQSLFRISNNLNIIGFSFFGLPIIYFCSLASIKIKPSSLNNLFKNLANCILSCF
jgi:hypothetical protein